MGSMAICPCGMPSILAVDHMGKPRKLQKMREPKDEAKAARGARQSDRACFLALPGRQQDAKQWKVCRTMASRLLGFGQLFYIFGVQLARSSSRADGGIYEGP